MLNRMVGSKIYTVSPQDYQRIGSDNLIDKLSMSLKKQGKNPYSIPVGGSNALGSFGYMETVREICEMGPALQFDHIVFACGSGGTAAGVAIGAKLAGLTAKVHGVGVCDSPEYFYGHIRQVAAALGLDPSAHGPVEDWISIYDGQGAGYGRSTDAELRFQIAVSQRTGVVLDPVYSGKALQYLVQTLALRFAPDSKVLFLHTGGTLGLFDKADRLADLLPQTDVAPLL